MQNDKIQEAIENLHNVLKDELGKYAVSAEVFISHAEYNFTYTTRTPDQLDSQNIAMKNLAGEFIR